MAGVEAGARDVRPARAGGGRADVAAEIMLACAGGQGRLVLSFPGRTAATLARRILAEAAVDADAMMVQDCMGEVANVVAGQAKALLVGSPSHFTLSTP